MPEVMAESPSDASAVPRAVWSSTALLALGRSWSALCGFFCLALLTRSDLPWPPLAGAEFGQLTYYLALYILLDGLADFGTSSAVQQLGASDLRSLASAVRAGRRVRRVAALSGWALISLAAWLAGERELLWISAACLAPLTRAEELSTAIYHSQIRWRTPVLVRSAMASLRLFAFACLAAKGVDSMGPYLLAFAWSGALGNLLLHLAARRQLRARSSARGSIAWQALFAGALPLAAVGLAQQAYFYGDNLILRAMVSPLELGHYNAAVKLLSLLLMASSFATTSALPWLTRQHHAGYLGTALTRLMWSLFPIACILLGALWPWSAALLGALFGTDFASAGPSLQWLLLGAGAIYLGAPLLTALVAASRSRDVLWVVLSGLGFNLLANPPLISRMGSAGAGLATFLTELLVALACYRCLARAGCRPTLRWGALASGPLLFLLAALLSSALGA